ncbi:sugar diacid recognition domain-containing protein [Thaumasiovibrio subtropicus]|uniref:sugar diacid recognition domain-containing protein n=1 Tax=Thaumasiovibrio subtropicus TaxID=1891207 RepID=UPI000B34B78B|nr:sugar diacid recognition domain-containing protein [Thaumasiovibrio subtropicus]
MQLTHGIARQIVARAMKIIQFSVNVMDENGLIIGSGDPSRINQRHEGAILALAEHRIVEIHAKSDLKGVKPGINLPILHNGKTIGVVGISGPPDQVHQYGELVRMTAEMIVEQAALMAQVQWTKRHREELVLQLIEGSTLSEQQLYSVAEQLEMDLSVPRVAAILKVSPRKDEIVSLDHLREVVQMLEFPERNNLVGIASVAQSEIVVLKPVTLDEHGWSRDQEEKRIAQLMQRIREQADYKVRIAVGDFYPGLSGLSHSYRTALATLRATPAGKKVMFYQDHILSVTLSGVDKWRKQQLTDPLERLRQQDPRHMLEKTLGVFFEQNCDLAQTCQKLHIHRNTLRYRLDKIEQITSLKFNNINDKTHLYLAVIALKQH